MLSAYPFGKLTNSINQTRVLVIGLGFLVWTDVVLAQSNHSPAVLLRRHPM